MKYFTLPYIRRFLRHYFGGLYTRADEHHMFLFAGGLAFSLFVCIVPFVLVIFWALGIILERSSLQLQTSTFIDQMIPDQRSSEFVKNLVFTRIEAFKAYKEVAGIIGAGGLFIAASGLFSSMRTILNRIFSFEKGKLMLVAILRDLGMVILVLVLFLVSTAILPALNIARDLAQSVELLKFLRFGVVQNLIIAFVSFLLIFIAFFFLYSLIPYAKLGWRIPALGAFWAALFWEAARLAFGYYVTHFATLKQIYGTYVLGVVVAFWIYYSSIIFILGAEIAQLYRERREALD